MEKEKMIQEIETRLNAVVSELDKNKRMKGTQWFADREELADALRFRIADLKSL